MLLKWWTKHPNVKTKSYPINHFAVWFFIFCHLCIGILTSCSSLFSSMVKCTRKKHLSLSLKYNDEEKKGMKEQLIIISHPFHIIFCILFSCFLRYCRMSVISFFICIALIISLSRKVELFRRMHYLICFVSSQQLSRELP